MRAYVKSGDVEYDLKPITQAEFDAAFRSLHVIDGQEVWTIKALAGLPAYYVPGTDLVWPLPGDQYEVIYED